MGVDLTLYPLLFDSGTGSYMPRTRVELNRRRELWGDIVDADIEKPWGRALDLLTEDDGYQDVTEDAYGTPLKYASAGMLWAVIAAFIERDGERDDINRAAAAYLSELPGDTKVVLWWH